MSAPYGIRHGKAKHSDELIAQIRMEYMPYVMGYKRLAKKYGISANTIRDWCSYTTRMGARG